MPPTQHLIEQFGYPFLFLGTFLEGETILVIAGFLAHRMYLRLPWVIAVAFAGSLLGDQVAFFLGRHKGRGMLDRRPKWRARATRVES